MSGQWEDGYKKPDNANNTTSAPKALPAGTVAGYHGPAPMELSALYGRKITPEERKRRREGALCMYYGDSRHFVASCPRKLKAVPGQVEINPFKEDLGKGKNTQDEGKVKEVESEKNLSCAITMANALETNFLCQLMLVSVFLSFLFKAQK
jgi:hypothetical protein